jgi:hypothetical protein
MPIVRRDSARSLTELAQRLYGLGPQDKRISEALKALTAANPGLPADLSTLPPATPIVVPALSRIAMASRAATAMPLDLDLLGIVRYVAEASKKIVAGAQTEAPPAKDAARAEMLQRFAAAQPTFKLGASIPQEADAQKLVSQLQVLTDNAEALVKRHGE